MANYDVYCSNCNRVFEMNIPIADYNEPAYCPVCGEPHQVVRVIVNAPKYKIRGGTRGPGYH